MLVVASYLLPLIVGLSYSADAADWDLGYFAVVGDRVGGRWLGWAVVGAAMVSQVGQFEAEMSTDSYLLHGMAERGFLPAAFARKSRHGTPTLAIASSALGVLAMARWARLFACVGVCVCARAERVLHGKSVLGEAEGLLEGCSGLEVQ